MSGPQITLNDGYQIPQLGLGVWQVGPDQIVPTVTRALEVGYRHIDTAALYRNEAGVGRAVRESGVPREHIFITTKLLDPGSGTARVELEKSLERLGLDYLDLYLIHWPFGDVRARLDAWETMQEARSQGLVRSIGVSNYSSDNLEEIVGRGHVVPAVNQVEYHPTYQRRDLQQLDTALGIGTQAYSPLGIGVALANPVVTEVAERVGKTAAQVVLRWHLQQGRIAIPKSVTPSRIAENFAIWDFELSGEEIALIDGLDTRSPLGWTP